MRLSGGELRGRKLHAKGLGKTTQHGPLRATSSKVREAVFDIIGPRIEGAVFVDLYAGTGAVSMEAMSRGASSVYIIEADRTRAAQISRLLDGCGCQAKATMLHRKALDFVQDAVKAIAGPWDIVFLDPPYHGEELSLILPALGQMLAAQGLVLAEHDKRTPLPEAPMGLEKLKTYRYGDTHITTYRKAQ